VDMTEIAGWVSPKYAFLFPPQQLKILHQLFKILGVEIKNVGEQ
jgi:hypothetical protein